LKRDTFGGQIFPLSDKVKPTCPSTHHDGLGQRFWNCGPRVLPLWSF